jgi:hypothetical protein
VTGVAPGKERRISGVTGVMPGKAPRISGVTGVMPVIPILRVLASMLDPYVVEMGALARLAALPAVDGQHVRRLRRLRDDSDRRGGRRHLRR